MERRAMHTSGLLKTFSENIHRECGYGLENYFSSYSEHARE